MRRLRRSAAAAGIVAVLLLTGCTSSDAFAPAPGPLPDGVRFQTPEATVPPAPDREFETLDGERIALSSLWDDRPVVLTFFESWCSDCSANQAAVNEAIAEYGDAVIFVAIAGESTPAQTREYAQSNDVRNIVGLDVDGELWRGFGVQEAPFTVLLAPGGYLLRGWPEYPEDLSGAVGTLLVAQGADEK